MMTKTGILTLTAFGLLVGCGGQANRQGTVKGAQSSGGVPNPGVPSATQVEFFENDARDIFEALDVQASTVETTTGRVATKEGLIVCSLPKSWFSKKPSTNPAKLDCRLETSEGKSKLKFEDAAFLRFADSFLTFHGFDVSVEIDELSSAATCERTEERNETKNASYRCVLSKL